MDEHSGMLVWNHNKLGAPGFAFTAKPLLAMCKNSVVYNVVVTTKSPPNNNSVTFVMDHVQGHHYLKGVETYRDLQT